MGEGDSFSFEAFVEFVGDATARAEWARIKADHADALAAKDAELERLSAAMEAYEQNLERGIEEADRLTRELERANELLRKHYEFDGGLVCYCECPHLSDCLACLTDAHLAASPEPERRTPPQNGLCEDCPPEGEQPLTRCLSCPRRPRRPIDMSQIEEEEDDLYAAVARYREKHPEPEPEVDWNAVKAWVYDEMERRNFEGLTIWSESVSVCIQRRVEPISGATLGEAVLAAARSQGEGEAE